MFKKVIVLVTFLAVAGLTNPVVSRADEAQTCTTVTQYNGSVSYVCGAHTPVKTGIGDNLALFGTLSLLASGVLLYFSKKTEKVNFSQGI